MTKTKGGQRIYLSSMDKILLLFTYKNMIKQHFSNDGFPVSLEGKKYTETKQPYTKYYNITRKTKEIQRSQSIQRKGPRTLKCIIELQNPEKK